LGGPNINLKTFLSKLEEISGIPSPKFQSPYWLALASAYAMEAYGRITTNGYTPAASVEGVRLVQGSFCFSNQKAQQELGYDPGTLDVALELAVQWHQLQI